MADWGRALETKNVGAYSVQILSPRPRHVTVLLEEAAKWADREFIVCGDRRISFARFLESSTRIGERLAQAGARSGAPALLLGANSPEWLAAFWGLAGQGAIVAQGNAWWTVDEIANAISLLEPSLIVADRKRWVLMERDPRFASKNRVTLEELRPEFERTGGVVAERQEDDEEAPAVLIFTSGTTGRPKAAILTHRAAISALHTIFVSRGRTPDELSASDPQMTLLCSNPLFHVGGFLLQAQCLLSGHRLVLLEGRFDAARVLELIEKENVNIWSTVPTLLSRALAHPDLLRRDLRSLKSFSASGSMVDPELVAAARKAFPQARAGGGTTYGMTESGGSVTLIGGEDYLTHPLSVGRALPGCELRIRDSDETGTGEILMRTPSSMSGYWRDSESSIVDSEGWLHSGDLGRIDSDGYLYVSGRSKDIIIRGGENVSAAVVEHALMQHPEVKEAAVIGLPNKDLGEEVAAVVVVEPDRSLVGAALSSYLAPHLGYFQIPTRWWIRTEPLPVNASGKVLKLSLGAAWCDQPNVPKSFQKERQTE